MARLPAATVLTLLALAGRVLAQSFPYPIPAGGPTSFDETVQPGACPGAFVGQKTSYTCTCVSSENSAAMVSCTPASDAQVADFCDGDASQLPCYADLCPSGTCDPLELAGKVITNSACPTGTSLGYKVVGGCSCYATGSRRVTACTGDAKGQACISEKLTLGGVSTGAISSFCVDQCSPGFDVDESGECVAASDASSSDDSADSNSTDTAAETTPASNNETATDGFVPLNKTSTSTNITISPSLQWPVLGLDNFDETLQPGQCAGIFNGTSARYSCSCVSSEGQHDVFISCAPIDDAAISAWCDGGINTASCYIELCPNGECPPVEIIGKALPDSTCTANQTLGYKVGTGCGCFGEDDGRHTPCPNSTAQVCLSERIGGTLGTGAVSSMCMPQFPLVSIPASSNLTTAATSSNSTSNEEEDSSDSKPVAILGDDGSYTYAVPARGKAVATAPNSDGSYTYAVPAPEVAAASPSTDPDFYVNETATTIIPSTRFMTKTVVNMVAQTSIVKVVNGSAAASAPTATITKTQTLYADPACFAYKFVYSPECCPTHYNQHLTPTSLPVARHRRRGHGQTQTLTVSTQTIIKPEVAFVNTTTVTRYKKVVKTVSGDAAPAAKTHTAFETVTVESGCETSLVQTVNKCSSWTHVDKQRQILHMNGYKLKGQHKVLVDCGSEGLFSF